MYGWGGPHEEDATFTATEREYMDDIAGLEYMEHYFISHTKPIKDGAHRILMVDGHSSHIDPDVVKKALDHNIYLICLSPHSTHIMQPLDVGCFGILAKEYKKTYQEWHYEEPYREVNKEHFWTILVKARQATYLSQVLESAWKAAGCWPVKRH